MPTYVIEFLLGRYCTTTNEEEIQEGLEIVKRQLSDRTVNTGDEEYFKSKARENGSIKLITIITARLDTSTDSNIATLPSLQLNRVRIPEQIIHENDRMPTGGFYAEIKLVQPNSETLTSVTVLEIMRLKHWSLLVKYIAKIPFTKIT